MGPRSSITTLSQISPAISVILKSIKKAGSDACQTERSFAFHDIVPELYMFPNEIDVFHQSEKHSRLTRRHLTLTFLPLSFISSDNGAVFAEMVSSDEDRIKYQFVGADDDVNVRNAVW